MYKRGLKSRKYAKRNYLRRRVGGKKIGVHRASKGFLVVKRKFPEMYIRNSGVAGSAITTDPTGTCISLGAPIADSFGGTFSIPFSMKFRLDQVISSTDITNLCDAYKLKYVSIGLTYLSTQASVSSIPVMPNVTWVTDHDDAVVPTTVDSLREKMGSKMRTFGFNKLVKIAVQPRVADSVFNNGLTTAYSVSKSLWMNSQYPGAEHYAIKGILGNVNLSASGTVTTGFKFDLTATIQGKDFQ